jgi:hypothetical protein
VVEPDGGRSKVEMQMLHHQFQFVSFHPVKNNWIVCVERNNYPTDLQHYQIRDKDFYPVTEDDEGLLKDDLNDDNRLNHLFKPTAGVKRDRQTQYKKKEGGTQSPRQGVTPSGK